MYRDSMGSKIALKRRSRVSQPSASRGLRWIVEEKPSATLSSYTIPERALLSALSEHPRSIPSCRSSQAQVASICRGRSPSSGHPGLIPGPHRARVFLHAGKVEQPRNGPNGPFRSTIVP